jgi:uncharacterized surface protein with fasciclin (FAS1) repeats
MKKTPMMLSVAAALAVAGVTPTVARDYAHPIVRPAQAKTVVDIAVGSPDHTTLVTAVQAAGLVETLSGDGPFTVFAPTNAAFAKVPAATLEAALRPENRALLTGVLTYHVVPGKVLAADLIKLIQDGGGQATVTTVQGGTLTARVVGGAVVLTDETGAQVRVTATDLTADNGVVHVVDGVLMPN